MRTTKAQATFRSTTFDAQTLDPAAFDVPPDAEQLAALRSVAWQALSGRELTAAVIAKEERIAREQGERPVMPYFNTEEDLGFRVFLYEAETGARALVYDTRGAGGLVPYRVAHAITGEPLLLHAYSDPLPLYPFRQGDRVVVVLSRERAYSRSAEELQRLETEHPAAFAKLAERYETRAACIEADVQDFLDSNEPDVVPASALLVSGYAEARKRYVAAAPAALEHPRYAEALAMWARHKANHDPVWADRSTEEALVSLRVHRHFDRHGETIGADAWHVQLSQSLEEIAPGDGIQVIQPILGSGTYEMRFVFMRSFVGLDVSVFDQREAVGWTFATAGILAVANGGPMVVRTRTIYVWHCETTAVCNARWSQLVRYARSAEAESGFATAANDLSSAFAARDGERAYTVASALGGAIVSRAFATGGRA